MADLIDQMARILPTKDLVILAFWRHWLEIAGPIRDVSVAWQWDGSSHGMIIVKFFRISLRDARGGHLCKFTVSKDMDCGFYFSVDAGCSCLQEMHDRLLKASTKAGIEDLNDPNFDILVKT